MIEHFAAILLRARRLAGPSFSGLGVLVADAPLGLPIIPLRESVPDHRNRDLASMLALLSIEDGEYHDGFHIVASDWALVRVAQYFAPPVVHGAKVNRSRPFGGRYLAALFGSMLPQVLLAATLSRHYGLVVFEDGREVFHEGGE